MADTSELQRRLARVRNPSTNGGSGAPVADPDDLDWLLFNSFPDCAVTPAQFAELLPAFELAFRAGSTFDIELLFVRALEIGDAAPEDARRSLGQAAADAVLAEDLDPSLAVAAIRFAIRVLPDPEAFLDRLLEGPSLDRLRWQTTLDFALDERPLDDYLALSYLRDADPDSGPRLESWPVPEDVRARLTAWLDPDESRHRLEEGFASFAEPEERAMLIEALETRVAGFSPPA